jgi:hypothetical protein
MHVEQPSSCHVPNLFSNNCNNFWEWKSWSRTRSWDFKYTSPSPNINTNNEHQYRFQLNSKTLLTTGCFSFNILFPNVIWSQLSGPKHFCSQFCPTFGTITIQFPVPSYFQDQDISSPSPVSCLGLKTFLVTVPWLGLGQKCLEYRLRMTNHGPAEPWYIFIYTRP